jgi:hypothetical protein
VEAQLPIIALVSDLMFSSRISATARAKNVEVQIVRDAKKLSGIAGRLLLVDLNQNGALDAAIAWRAQQNAPVIGFVSHVDTEMISRAKQAGIDQVMARSQFVNQLNDLLQSPR